MKKLNVLISAGGTGGHLIPAQQLAKKLISDRKSRVVFMAKGLFLNQNFRKENYKFIDISSGPLTKKKFVFSAFSILKGTIQSIFYLFKNKIDVVAGFGSYHTFPVLLAAYLLKIPIVVFESNCLLGKVNRFFAKKAKIVATQFKIKNREKYKNIKLVPLLPWIEQENKIDKDQARVKLNLKKELFTILVFGGSQGASFINEVFVNAVLDINKIQEFQVIHICGNEEKKRKLEKLYNINGITSYVSIYEKDMIPIYCAADLAVCRSGAVTIAELIFFEIPAYLIPYPHSSEKHQEINGFFLSDNIRGGVVYLQKDFNQQKFTRDLFQSITQNSKKQMEMKANLCDFKSLVNNENRQSLNKVIYEAT